MALSASEQKAQHVGFVIVVFFIFAFFAGIGAVMSHAFVNAFGSSGTVTKEFIRDCGTLEDSRLRETTGNAELRFTVEDGEVTTVSCATEVP